MRREKFKIKSPPKANPKPSKNRSSQLHASLAQASFLLATSCFLAFAIMCTQAWTREHDKRMTETHVHIHVYAHHFFIHRYLLKRKYFCSEVQGTHLKPPTTGAYADVSERHTSYDSMTTMSSFCPLGPALCLAILLNVLPTSCLDIAWMRCIVI